MKTFSTDQSRNDPVDLPPNPAEPSQWRRDPRRGLWESLWETTFLREIRGWCRSDAAPAFGIPLIQKRIKSAQRGSFRPDIRPKTSVRPSKSWKNKHFGTDMPRGRPRKNFGLKNFGLIFRSLLMSHCCWTKFPEKDAKLETKLQGPVHNLSLSLYLLLSTVYC